MSEPPSSHGVMIVLAYLWPLAVVPLLADKQDPEVQWHAKHGVVLMLAEVVLVSIFIIVAMLVSLANVSIGCVLFLLLLFGWVAVLGLHVAAIVKGVNGQRLIVPVVSAYADRW